MKAYRINSVRGDRYGGEWPAEQFRKYGVSYEASERTKSEIYVDVLPLINSHLAALLDNATLMRQFIGLERRTARSGKDSIDHAPGAKDDVANAVAGVLVLAAEDNIGVRGGRWDMSMNELMAHIPGPESGGSPRRPRWPRGNVLQSSLGDNVLDCDRGPS